MSRIFDALQRSGLEQTGIEYPDMVSVATEVFEASQPQGSAHAVNAHLGPELLSRLESAVSLASATEVSAAPQGVSDVPKEFPALEVSVTPASRLVFLTEPDGIAAEKFRFLGVRLRQLRQNRPLKKILITSTIPEEGKSLVAANLAGVLARRKEKVLLIEGDMRRPTLAQQFGVGRLAGLAEWLQSGMQTPSNIYRLGGPDFWLLPAGNPPANALELMQSGKLSQLMAHLSTMFDWIIVDSPPLLPLADATVWVRFTDGTLLVTREGKTEKASLKRGLEALKKSDLLGVVLNDSSHVEHDYYYHRHSSPAPK
jgi:protein-tyrosine kinase